MPTKDSTGKSEVEETTNQPAESKGRNVLSIVLTAARRNWPALIALALMFVLYWDTMRWWYKEWMKDESYYSHGPLVLPIALFMVWSIRAKLKEAAVRPSLWGLLPILFMVPMYILGRKDGHSALTSAAFMGMLIGAILLIYGPKITKLLLFPTLFLIAMIPLPSFVLDDVTGPVQRASANGAYYVLKVMYPETVRNNVVDIRMPSWEFKVAVECSGFKLLISLLTFTAFFAYMLEGQFRRKLALFIFAGPFAVFINILRVVMIGLAGEWFGEEAGHAFHDYSGYVVLIIAFVILFKIAGWFGCKDFGETAFAPMQGDIFSVSARNTAMWRNSFVLAGVFALVLGSNQIIPKTEDVVGQASINKVEFSKEFGHWMQDGRDYTFDQTTLQELKTAALLGRDYRNVEGYKVEFLTVAGIDNDAFHSPRSCLPGGGWQLGTARTVKISVPGSKENVVVATEIPVFAREDPTERRMVLYWYQTGSKTLPTTGKSRLQKFVATVKGTLEQREQVRETTYFYRLITTALDGDEAARERLLDFTREFTLARQPYID